MEEGDGVVQDATVTTATVVWAEVCLAVPATSIPNKNTFNKSTSFLWSCCCRCCCPCPCCVKNPVLLAIAAVVVVVLIVVVVPLWLVFFPTSNHPTSTSSTTSTNNMDSDPVWDVTSRAAQLPSRLLELPQLTLADLLAASSPQAQAMDWLIYQDTFLTSVQDPNLVPRFALLVLAMATASDLWLTTQPWHLQTSEHHCDWIGMDCQVVETTTTTTQEDSATTRVVWSMDLSNLRLTGSLPREIGLLTDLRTLILNQNKLEGSLPSEIFGLESLESLELFRNQFSSTISTQFAQLTNLRSFFLGYNDWTGTFPSTSLQSLVHLEHFQLTESSLLHGDTTTLLQQAANHLPNLQSLALSGLPQFQAGIIPTAIGTLTNLEAMVLSRVAYNIPSELGLLTRLTGLMMPAPLQLPSEDELLDLEDTLNVTSSDFVSAIPVEMGQLTNLNFLVLAGGSSSTPRKGQLPSELGLLVQLNHLDLSTAALTGTLPTELGQLSLLQKLYLDHNQFQGTIPSEWHGIVSEMDMINLVGLQITGTVPEFFCGEAITIYATCDTIECDCCEDFFCNVSRE
eukprot:Nitzschia sp. Nitz4//scaffold47_size129522//64425//66352//NITZ4_003554-RA/size129522-snap-gene-0.198-mRNA-1//-1//CDS//3329552809//3822//frame0